MTERGKPISETHRLKLVHGQQLRRAQERGIACSWCGKMVRPKAPRMRLFDSEGIRVSGRWLAHFHPECGDALLDFCERRQCRLHALDPKEPME